MTPESDTLSTLTPSQGNPLARLNSGRVQIGVEEEWIVIVGGGYNELGLLLGEVIPDLRLYIPTQHLLSKRNHGDATEEVTTSVVETYTPPFEPHRYQYHLDQISESGQRLLKEHNLILSPMSEVALLPFQGRYYRPHLRDERGFRISDKPTYVPYVYAAVEEQFEDHLGLSGTHVHGSMGGQFDRAKNLQVSADLQRLGPFFVAMFGSQCVNAHGFFKAKGSTRTINWIRDLKATFDMTLGRTEQEREAIRLEALDVIHLNPKDENAMRRIFITVRPNFEHGTAEGRWGDRVRSKTERRLLGHLYGGAIETVANGVPWTGKTRVTGMDHLLLEAALDGMYPSPGSYGRYSRHYRGDATLPKEVRDGHNVGMRLMFHPEQDRYRPMEESYEWIIGALRPFLERQGTWNSVKRDLDALRSFGSGAKRQYDDICEIHERFRLQGIPGSNYDLMDFRRGRVPMSPAESRALHLVTAIGINFELWQVAERKQAVEQALDQLVLSEKRVRLDRYGVVIKPPTRQQEELDLQIDLGVAPQPVTMLQQLSLDIQSPGFA